jgi:dipeptidyl aminopeptidase/acylaminoacyl peptidase
MVRFDEAVMARRHYLRSRIDADIEIRVRSADGTETVVATRPTTDSMARNHGGNVVWRGGEAWFRIKDVAKDGAARYETRAWNLTTHRVRTVSSSEDNFAVRSIAGPRGGELASVGVGDRRELIETLGDGREHSYGSFAFQIGDPRGAAAALSSDGTRAVVGVRFIDRPRYGLALISRRQLREISDPTSLTRCDFTRDIAWGICVREGIKHPPELVRVDMRQGRVSRIVPTSREHERIAPLDIRQRSWTNRLGYKVTGFVVYPRGYELGHRYPAIVVTHGSDADERFANTGFQWEYPVQAWAERGYMVLLINDPGGRSTAEIFAAHKAWSIGKGPPGPEEVRKLLWLNGAYAFEDAVNEMAREGLIDPARVGIAGFSRGSQMVNITLTQSKLFRAASGGDGSYLEPSAYPSLQADYGVIYGGSPYGDQAQQYRDFAPSLNAHKVCGALLQQLAVPQTGSMDFHDALRQAHVPAQLTLYPGESEASEETHVFHIPSNRILAQRENIAWFDYWLLDKRDPDMVFPERLAVWDAMATDPAFSCRPR